MPYDVLQSVGMTRIDPVMYKGNPVVPMEFLKCLLPEPSSLAEGYSGKTSIGVVIKGHKDGEKERYMSFIGSQLGECANTGAAWRSSGWPGRTGCAAAPCS